MTPPYAHQIEGYKFFISAGNGGFNDTPYAQGHSSLEKPSMLYLSLFICPMIFSLSRGLMKTGHPITTVKAVIVVFCQLRCRAHDLSREAGGTVMNFFQARLVLPPMLRHQSPVPC